MNRIDRLRDINKELNSTEKAISVVLERLPDFAFIVINEAKKIVDSGGSRLTDIFGVDPEGNSIIDVSFSNTLDETYDSCLSNDNTWLVKGFSKGELHAKKTTQGAVVMIFRGV